MTDEQIEAVRAVAERESETIPMYACLCGRRDEGQEEPPLCKHCKTVMFQWNTREVTKKGRALSALPADTRTSNGGY